MSCESNLRVKLSEELNSERAIVKLEGVLLLLLFALHAIASIASIASLLFLLADTILSHFE